MVFKMDNINFDPHIVKYKVCFYVVENSENYNLKSIVNFVTTEISVLFYNNK